MIHCASCEKPKPHFTAIDDGRMGYYCDECVIGGKLAVIGVTIPDVPGVNQLSRESVIPQEFTSAPAGPR